MRRLKRLIADEEGSASIEFIGAGILLLVPLLYLVITLAQIQGQTFGIDAAARYVSRIIAQNPDSAHNAMGNATLVAEQYGIEPDVLAVSISCDEPGPCPVAGALVTVTVSTAVALPLIPGFLTDGGAMSVPITAHSTHKVSQYGVTE